MEDSPNVFCSSIWYFKNLCVLQEEELIRAKQREPLLASEENLVDDNANKASAVKFGWIKGVLVGIPSPSNEKGRGDYSSRVTTIKTLLLDSPTNCSRMHFFFR